MKHIFEQAIANVQSAYPSIYTKEDVIRLIQDIQEPVLLQAKRDGDMPPLDQMALQGIKESLLEGVKNISIEDFVSLELNYDNRIDVEVDERGLMNEIEQCFDIAVTEVMPAPKD